MFALYSVTSIRSRWSFVVVSTSVARVPSHRAWSYTPPYHEVIFEPVKSPPPFLRECDVIPILPSHVRRHPPSFLRECDVIPTLPSRVWRHPPSFPCARDVIPRSFPRACDVIPRSSPVLARGRAVHAASAARLPSGRDRSISRRQFARRPRGALVVLPSSARVSLSRCQPPARRAHDLSLHSTRPPAHSYATARRAATRFGKRSARVARRMAPHRRLSACPAPVRPVSGPAIGLPTHWGAVPVARHSSPGGEARSDGEEATTPAASSRGSPRS